MRLAVVPGVMFVGTLVLDPELARAEGEPCWRDTECAGAELCVDGSCSAPATGVPTCTSDDTCDGSKTVCVDGYCKHEGVVCRAPLGECWVEESSSRCACTNGENPSSVDSYDPDNPPPAQTDDELAAECTAVLAESCDDGPAMLPDSCTGEVLAACEDYVEKEDALWAACGEDGPESNVARVGECCETYDSEDDAAYRECVLAIESEGCQADAFDECDGATPKGENEEQADATNEGGTKAGCRVGGSSPWAVLGLGLVAFARRRRRSR